MSRPKSGYRIAKLILPKHDNSGVPFPRAISLSVEDALIKWFGGFTTTEVRGSWIEGGDRYDDESIEYSVWYHNRSDDGATIKRLARGLLGVTDQLAIAVIMDGVPQLIKAKK